MTFHLESVSFPGLMLAGLNQIYAKPKDTKIKSLRTYNPCLSIRAALIDLIVQKCKSDDQNTHIHHPLTTKAVVNLPERSRMFISLLRTVNILQRSPEREVLPLPSLHDLGTTSMLTNYLEGKPEEGLFL